MASEDEPTQVQTRVPRRRATRRATTPDAPALTGLDEVGTGDAGIASPEAPESPADGTDAAVDTPTAPTDPVATEQPVAGDQPAEASADAAPPVRRTRKRATRPAAAPEPAAEPQLDAAAPAAPAAPAEPAPESGADTDAEGAPARPAAPTFGLLFQPPAPPPARPSRRRAPAEEPAPSADEDTQGSDGADEDADRAGDDTEGDTGRRRRRRGGKGRRRPGDESAADGDADAGRRDGQGGDQGETDQEPAADQGDADAGGDDEAGGTGRKRTRRRRRSGSATDGDDPPGTVTRVREPRRDRDEATGIRGSTRLEAKKQRRREGREAGRRRSVITEAEFLARRESVERVMVVRQRGERTQIGVLEDGILVEHYVSTAGSGQGGANGVGTSIAGNVYLGRVQNVLPSMEAAFVDIGKGRNAVLYAGEVNWDAAGLESNKNRRIEQALSSGQGVLVQVTKDPIGHKGARLTSQVSLPGRFLVYVPDGTMTGISRKLPDTERARLKKILREIVPENAGVIVRTAAEGASEAELKADVERLTKIWDGIQRKAKSASAPALLHGEVDLTVRVIRDVFNEDFASLVVAGDQAWETVGEYVESVAPDLAPRLTKWTGEADVFAHYRIDEQLAKAMDRKVWLPSGGSLVIDRTEAMTVVDVNTGKFVGSGGNLEETVTKNNIEAAEEIVRQLRLRDIGGIIVIDFIDMVLESNRDLVIRRLLECLGRDRTKHQVAEVTSLGLVQMTRKRVGAGLIEVFSEACEHCNGRGLLVRDEPVERTPAPSSDGGSSGGGRSGRGRRGRGGSGDAGRAASGSGSSSGSGAGTATAPEKPAPTGPTPAQIAAQAYAAALHASGHDSVETGPAGGGDVAPDTDAAGGPGVDGVPGAGDDARGEFESDAVTGSVSGLEPEGDALEDDAQSHYPAPRARRKRGRVMAPAGPPRAQADSDDGPDDGPDNGESAADSDDVVDAAQRPTPGDALAGDDVDGVEGVEGDDAVDAVESAEPDADTDAGGEQPSEVADDVPAIDTSGNDAGW